MPKFLPGQSGNPAGLQPKTVKRAQLPLITKLAARGVREADIARAVSMSVPTWHRCKSEQDEVQDALDAGRQKMHDSLLNKLYERAMEGEVVPLLFLLKARFGYREGDPQADNSRPQVIINMPSPLSPEQYRVVQHEPLALPEPDDD